MHVHGPTLGIPSPSLDALLAVSDGEARTLWDAACGLAAWRLTEQAALYDRLVQWQAEPWSRAQVSVGRPEPALEPDDLARAVVALRPDLLQRLDGPAFRQATATWRERIAVTAPLPLAPAWGRRWAPPPAAIDVPELIRSLPWRTLRGVARLDPSVQEGLCTAEEGFGRLIEALSARRSLGAEPAPAYLAREPDAAWIGRLAHGPGVVLLGPPGAGKRAVVAQLRRWTDRPVNIDNWHGGGRPERSGKYQPADVPASVAAGFDLVCVWTRLPDVALLGYATELALDPDARFQLVLAVSPGAWDQARIAVPELQRLPVAPVPPLADDELLPVWLCQRPWLEDQLGERFDLARIVCLGADRLRPLLAALDPHDRTVRDRTDALRAVMGTARLRSAKFWLRRHPKLAPDPDALLALDAALSGE